MNKLINAIEHINNHRNDYIENEKDQDDIQWFEDLKNEMTGEWLFSISNEEGEEEISLSFAPEVNDGESSYFFDQHINSEPLKSILQPISEIENLDIEYDASECMHFIICPIEISDAIKQKIKTILINAGAKEYQMTI
jgi:hypothetical protein